MESCKISIIVPVFNAKCTIERCLNSLVSQTYHNREIIVIDDGSSDGSGDIIDAFAKNTKDIQTIHTENRGVSAARNRGIKESSGDFLMFVDADDELTLDCLEMMVQHSEAVQLVACEAMNIYDDDISECNEQIQDISKYKEIYYIGENVFIEYFRKSGFACSLCTKLYRKELFKNITIPESIKYGEDARVMTRICDRCESMVYIPQKMYLIMIFQEFPLQLRIHLNQQ